MRPTTHEWSTAATLPPGRDIRLSLWLRRSRQLSSNLAVEASEDAISRESTNWRTGKESIKAETLARIVENEEALHEDQKDVEPRPLIRVMVETEPEVRDE